MLKGMAGRSTRASLREQGLVALHQALDEVGVDLAAAVPGPVDVIGAARISAAVPEGLRHAPNDGTLRVVVADSISRPARAVLNDAGVNWLDRRGHLRLVAPGLVVDTAVRSQPRHRGHARRAVDKPIRGRGGLAAALDALWRAATGEALTSTSDVARRAGLSQPTVYEATRTLRDAGLIGKQGANVPDLFWETADAWRPTWVDLVRLPQGRDAAGLLAGGTRAAIHHGIGLVARDDHPWELYGADEHQIALARVRATGAGPVVARLALAPTPLALEHPAHGEGPFPYVNAVVAAIDAAADPSRGAEAVRAWDPEGMRRVW